MRAEPLPATGGVAAGDDPQESMAQLRVDAIWNQAQSAAPTAAAHRVDHQQLERRRKEGLTQGLFSPEPEAALLTSAHGPTPATAADTDAAALEVPLSPDDYTKADGRLVQLLEAGVVRLVRADAIIALSETPDARICALQDAPDDWYHPAPHAAAMWRQSEALAARDVGYNAFGLWLHSVSYCWLTQSHPDPEGFHLRRLAMVLRALRRCRELESDRDGDTGPFKLPLDVGVFWDFLSLPQEHCAAGNRTDLEARCMRVALGNMQLLYANHFILVLKLTVVPPPPSPLIDGKWLETDPDPVTGKKRRLGWVYADKGWTTFEESVGNINLKVFGARLTIDSPSELELSERLGAVLSAGNGSGTPARGAGGLQTPQSRLLRGFGLHREPPKHPDRFDAELKTKAFYSLTDASSCMRLYRQTFEAVVHASDLDAADQGWGEDEATVLSEVLVHFSGMKRLKISGNPIGDRGLSVLSASGWASTLTQLFMANCQVGDAGAAALAQGGLPPRLERMRLAHNAIGDVGVAALAQALPATLIFLTLDGNRIGDDGAVALARAGLPPSNRTEVWLGANRVGDAGATAVARAGLQCNWTSVSAHSPQPL